MKFLYLLGAGGHMKQVIDILEMKNMLIRGIFDDNINKIGKTFYRDYRIIDTIDNARRHLQSRDKLFCGIGDNFTRKKVQAIFKDFEFINVISPFSRISEHVKLGKGNYIGHYVNISGDTVIGNGNIINDMSCITYDVTLGDYNHLCPLSVLSGAVKVGDLNLIGTKTNVNPYIKIGNQNVIGSGSAVIRDVKDNLVLAGVPCKIIRGKEPESFLSRVFGKCLAG